MRKTDRGGRSDAFVAAGSTREMRALQQWGRGCAHSKKKSEKHVNIRTEVSNAVEARLEGLGVGGVGGGTLLRARSLTSKEERALACPHTDSIRRPSLPQDWTFRRGHCCFCCLCCCNFFAKVFQLLRILRILRIQLCFALAIIPTSAR